MNKHIKMILFSILSNGSEIDSNVYGKENQFQLWVLGVICMVIINPLRDILLSYRQITTHIYYNLSKSSANIRSR